MRKNLLTFFLLSSIYSTILYGAFPTLRNELKQNYVAACNECIDINEHLPQLRKLAAECSSAIGIGVGTRGSTWGILQGLSENSYSQRSYLGIDPAFSPAAMFELTKRIAEGNGISFDFWKANVMTIDIMPADLLFIDSLHTYCNLTYELEKFSPKVRKYIAIHDTSYPWGNIDDTEYRGNYSEYPAEYDRTKRGLWPAVEDFLQRHPEWTLQERRLNNHGFTVLKRI